LNVVDSRAPISIDVARQRAERAREFLAADRRVRIVYLFGSAAVDQPSVRDVDIGILTEPPLGLDELLDLRADVARAAGGPIDLVSLNSASVVLAREVAESGRCLFADPPEAETEFVVRARSRYMDFKPFLDEQWRLAGERGEERRRRGSSS
jgi:predicted nucleotidyltransferase